MPKQDLWNEPACGHNQKKGSKQKCPAPKPGGNAGGCAFDGAQIVLVPIADSAHLVHGPIACLGNSWDSRGSLSSGPELYKMAFTTDMNEESIVFGGEKNLLRSILELAEEYHPPSIFVYSTCVSALIGDDLATICHRAQEKTGIPVIPVDSPGFLGSKNLGNRAAGQALLDCVVGTSEPEGDLSRSINLIGEYNIAGELWNMTPLFERLGIRILSTMTGDGRYHQIATAHRAKANMVVCSKALINIGRQMKDQYNIPYFEGSFYGKTDTSKVLRNIAELIGDPDLIMRTESLIREEESLLDKRLEPLRRQLRGKKALIYTGGVKSWSVISALQDLGLVVVATGVGKSTEEDKERIRDLLGPQARMIEDGSPKNLLSVMAEFNADILIAGGRNQYTALKSRLPFLDINQERHHTYTGYEGMVELAQELVHCLTSPVFAEVRRPSPWES